MRLRFFGRLRDVAGTSERDLDLPMGMSTVGEARRWLGGELPQLLEATVRIALDDRLARDPDPIGDAKEMSFFPPVSGG